MAIGTGGNKDALSFGIFNESEKFFVDKRFPLLIQEQVKNSIASFINNFFEGLKIHESSFAGHSAVTSHTKRTF